MNSKPDLEHGIYRVTHCLVRGNVRSICESDMIVIDDQPFVVLEWAGPEGNQYPSVKVLLDFGRLQGPPTPEGYVVYDGDVVDPRPTH
jgi:hypothetical protein